jgi:hypothetical protein
MSLSKFVPPGSCLALQFAAKAFIVVFCFSIGDPDLLTRES